ncbi:MAG: aspartate aminotransferase family protein [Planctomycetales bacterium]|nr:aspartate aminotransferase family protein [Planctomycetales bacterium]
MIPEQSEPVLGDGAKWLDRFRAVHPQAACRDHDPKFGPVFVRGQGARLWDVAGQDYLDLTCGYSAANFGHAFAPLVAAAERQLRQLTHLTGEPHAARIELAERLIELLEIPARFSKVMFNVSGARAIETAWKAALAYRPGKLLTLGPCFHGRSLATSSLSNASASRDWGVVQREQIVHRQEYPYCAACVHQLSYPSCHLHCVQALWAMIRHSAADLSAVLVEPAIGARGYIFPPPTFLQQLRRVTAEEGILLIADEVQTALGRCGDWLLSRQQGWQPDLLVLGKSLGGGIAPLSAVVGRGDVLECLPAGSESETFAGSPLATAVALEVLRQLQHGGWMQRGVQLGQALRDGLAEELAQLPARPAEAGHALVQGSMVQDGMVQGQAATCIVEFASSGAVTSEPLLHRAQRRAKQFAQACQRQRLLVHFSGPLATRVVLLPPLTLSDEELSEVQRRLQRAVQQQADE